MKKILLTLTIAFSIVFLASCSSGPTLRLYNWGEYIDDALVEAFEDTYDISVKQIAFDSNEVAVTQMKAGNQYDLVIPSDYAIEQLASENLIDPIDWSKITTFNKDSDIATGLESVLTEVSAGSNGFDILEYSVPYFWGNVGILYNTTVVDQTDLTGWDVLLDSATYEIAFYNSSRDAYMQAMFATGTNDINNPTTAEFDAATAWLNDALTADTYVITDDIFEAMAKPSIYDLAVSYSGDANYLMMENDDLDFFVPNEGTNVWVDGFVIPKGAQTDYAYEFISFMLSYDAAKQNSEWVGYTSPRQDVLTDLLNDEFAAYASSYDVRINSNDLVYRYDEDLKVQIDNSWQEILANKGFDEEGVGSGTLVAVILVIVVVVGSGAVSFFRKKRKLA